MPKSSIFCNGFEVGHSKEAFCILFKFLGPNGDTIEVAYVTISPSGTKTLLAQLAEDMKDYEKEHGQVETWNKAGNSNSSGQTQSGNRNPLVS